MSESTTIFPPFTVTPAAIAQIVSLGGAVRIDAQPGGCCGTTYAFSKADELGDVTRGDERYGCPGAWLIVGAAVKEAMPGAILDYAGNVRPPRFRVLKNPNTANVCPCRRSFGSPWPGPKQPTCCSYMPMPWDDEFVPPTAWQKQTGYRDDTSH